MKSGPLVRIGIVAIVQGHRKLFPRVIRLETCDLVHAPCVPPAFKRRLQPNLDHALDQFLAKQVGRKAKNVGVVVSAVMLS